MANKSFHDFYNDDQNVPQTERAKIEFEVELTGKLIAAREAKGYDARTVGGGGAIGAPKRHAAN